MMPLIAMLEFAMLSSGLARSAMMALPLASEIEIESVLLLASPSKATMPTSVSTLPVLAV